MWDYDPVMGNSARHQILNLAMAREVHEGRGPIYLDIRQASQADRELARKELPTVFKMFDRAGKSPFDEPKEWVPAMRGTQGAGGGIFLNSLYCETNVPNVFAAGDICWMPVHGTYSFGGVNLGFTGLSGDISGRAAAQFITNNGIEMPHEPSKAMVSSMLSSHLVPITRTTGLNPDELAQEIRKVIAPYNIALIKNAQRLDQALQRIKHIQTEMIPQIKANSVRELSKAFEARSMSTIAELILRASIFREESRGFHFREEFPYTDNDNWLKWVILKRREDGEVIIRAEPVATLWIKPGESRSLPPGLKRSR